MFDPNYGWSDAARRREAERLALHQPLVGLNYSQPWPPTWQWTLMGLILGAVLVWGICS